MKYLKKIIIVLVICIIILLFFLINLLNKEEENNNIIDEFSNDEAQTSNEVFKNVESYNVYYTARNILNNYVKYFEDVNSDVKIDMGKLQMTEEQIKEYQYEEGLNAIYNIFDKQYVEEQNVDNSFIITSVEKYKNVNSTSNYNIQLKEMYVANITSDISLVLINSTINNVEFDCMLKLDLANSAYSIFWDDYLTNNGYTKDREEKIEEMDYSIEPNDYNFFQYTDATNENIVMQYFSDYKEKILNAPEQAYELLDKEYKEKRFATYDEFLEFINQTKEMLQDSEIEKYNFENNEISILDNYNNIYTFKVDDIINYRIQLDDYTIESGEFADTYNKATDKDKVYMNVEKFFKMSNNKDYKKIYSILDDTFKQNNYSTINDLQNFMNQNIFEYCKVKSVEKFEKSGAYYICSVKIANVEDESSEKEITIIMQLLEDRNFVMSFSM